FVVEVAAPVADLAPLPGQRPHNPLAVPRPRLGAGLTALQLRDHLRRRRQESRIGDHLAVAGGQEPGHAQIDADLAPGRRQRYWFRLGNHDDVPAAVLPLELECLDGAAHLAVLVYLDRP